MELTPQEQLHMAFPGRSRQIDQILGFMGEPWAPTPPAMLINGNSSLGKTAVVKSILSTMLGHTTPSRYAFLDCVECHTPRLIFEHAIYQLQNAPKKTRLTTCAESQQEHGTLDGVKDSSWTTTKDAVQAQASNTTRPGREPRKRKRAVSHEQPIWSKCENVNEFVEWCRKICDSDTPQAQETSGVTYGGSSRKQDTRYLILDRAERLRDTAPALIPVLMRLQELTGRNICVILITTIVWEKFRSKTGGYEPIILNFPQYSKAETIAILKRDLPVGGDEELYMRFVDLVYDVFQRNCKDLNEIRHLVALLYPLYIKPIKEGKAQRSEALKLHKHIQAYFVEAMDKLYLREISSAEWSDRTLASSAGSHSGKIDSTLGDSASRRLAIGAPGSERAMMTAVDVQNTFDLPYYTKFILIASFLASYNPPRLDMRYFAKVSNQGGKMTKRAKQSAAKKHGHDQMGSKLRQQLLGPKTFPIERMLAIFYSILDEDVEENINVHTQIASLVSLRLLQRVTPMDKLDSIKCKCSVSYDTIKTLAKSTKFEIDKYLYDFV
ncbi:Origin recognition complex subunit 5 [Mortierella alpina]|uniref:Origin recognition complex subunit 5 n=1 Tax=Mortierella alpina TaxID=64518 RepID=A0A9P6J9Q7_MORAP|nr:Origin recognition complex subunit 5 [Mortierella alpina]